MQQQECDNRKENKGGDRNSDKMGSNTGNSGKNKKLRTPKSMRKKSDHKVYLTVHTISKEDYKRVPQN